MIESCDNSPAPPASRGCLQFRLRTLLATLILLCFPLGFAVELAREAREYDEAVQTLEAFPGSIRFAEPEEDSLRDRLRVWMGQARRPAQSLCLEDVSDAELYYIGRLNRLKTLRLSGYKLTDDGAVHLRRLQELEELRLIHTLIGDQGAASLAGLRNLRKLSLRGADVTDAGLASLESLPQLESLVLEQTLVTPAGVARLQAALPGCRIAKTHVLPRHEVAQDAP